MIRVVGCITVAAGVAALTPAAFGQQVPDAGGIDRNAPAVPYADGRILLKFREAVPQDVQQEIRDIFGGETLQTYRLVPRLELISTFFPVDQTLWLLQDIPAIEYAEPDFVTHTTVFPNDQFFTLQWGLHNFGQTINGVTGIPDADIDAVEAWDINTGDADFVIAVADTGTMWTHIDLNDNIWVNIDEVANNGIDDDGNGFIDDVRGWDFYANDNNPFDENGHGTHTSGTVGAEGNNGIGVAGVMWDVSIMPVRHLGPNGTGFISAAIGAISYAVNNGAKVSNHSWGTGGYSQGLSNVISFARQRDHLVVAAAGNSGRNTDQSPFYPASFGHNNVISVAWMTNRDLKAPGSNYGPNSVDLGAPGEWIASTWNNGGWVYSSGTSMASPHVAGVAGLVWSQNPDWTYLQVRQQLFDTVRPVTSMQGITVTGGMVNARAALEGTGGGPAELVDFTILDGELISGGVNRMRTSNDLYLEIEARVTGEVAQPHLMRLRIGAETAARNPSTIDLTIESHITDVEATAWLFLRDWDNNRTVQVDEFEVGLEDSVHQVTVTNASRFVRASDGRIVLTVKKIVFFPFTLGGFHSLIDLVELDVQ